MKRVDAPCESDCRPCAPCSDYDERLLRTYAPRPDCDCGAPVGIDPCFSVSSCDRYGKTLAPLAAACPGVFPRE